jgi:hypothetical protein
VGLNAFTYCVKKSKSKVRIRDRFFLGGGCQYLQNFVGWKGDFRNISLPFNVFYKTRISYLTFWCLSLQYDQWFFFFGGGVCVSIFGAE